MSPYRPLIAVVGYHLGPGRVTRWPDGGYGVPAPYLDALRRAHARPLIVSPGEPGDPQEVLEPFDGLLLVGGGDVDPSRYGAGPDAEHLYGIEPDRDELEIALLREAHRRAMPTLCVCRGMQVMNVAFGGTLHQHLPAIDGLVEHGVPLEDTVTLHDVTPVAGSRLSASTKSHRPLTCSSHHHQGVDRIGDGLLVTGHAPDGLVEAIELPNDPDDPDAPWMLGVQWHPEETAGTDPEQQSLFDALSLIAHIRGTKARPGATEGRSRAYAISDHDPAWPSRFDAEAERIRSALPSELVTRIEHVGSTSVPGLAAKPTIDIQLSLTAMVPRSAYVDPLRGLGYRWLLDPWDDEHEYFSRDVDGGRAFQIHVCPAGSGWERRHLAFRDALRADPELTAAYERLKRELAAAHPRDIQAYNAGKTPFIREVEARVLASG
ncbi:MAG TPA: gamma-glutamyl-gamma-aminobutyrate hydrolase family protein [Actinomycetota bacterium]|jgi:putative glutamine amidotransferase